MDKIIIFKEPQQESFLGTKLNTQETCELIDCFTIKDLFELIQNNVVKLVII